MSQIILFSAIVILACIVTNKFSSKLGMPTLVFFMFLGVLFGCDGIFKISFDDYDLTSKLCSIGLLFIIFYGGFCTRKPDNKIVATQAILLSSFGTILTAFLTYVFCFWVLKIPQIESFIIGAVISSTDAASVFSILRSKRLNLKYSTAPILEMESGSNDPFAYILTILGITLLNGGNAIELMPLLIKQILFGIFFGVIIALIGILIFKKTKLIQEGTDTLFIVALALASFAIPDLLQGNGFLSVYITGIILGNSEFRGKINLIHFFDGITALFQVVIFFLIGFLSHPNKIPQVIIPALLVTVFLTFIARPLAISAIMLPFKAKINQIFYISAAGLRGAASIAFAILVVAQGIEFKYDLFHIVFVVALLSVTFQGALLPYLAKKSDMIDRYSDVRKTFNDFQQESAITLNKILIKDSHPWQNQKVKDLTLSDNALILFIKRNGEKIIPNGETEILKDDKILIGTTVVNSNDEISLCETTIDKNHEWLDKELNEIKCDNGFLIALIKRNEDYFVPNGDTKILLNDTLIFYET
ncbi:potassium/proton antiporter [bacterium]|nr:potassium/proton antiporter [bacterium]